MFCEKLTFQRQKKKNSHRRTNVTTTTTETTPQTKEFPDVSPAMDGEFVIPDFKWPEGQSIDDFTLLEMERPVDSKIISSSYLQNIFLRLEADEFIVKFALCNKLKNKKETKLRTTPEEGLEGPSSTSEIECQKMRAQDAAEKETSWIQTAKKRQRLIEERETEAKMREEERGRRIMARTEKLAETAPGPWNGESGAENQHRNEEED
jgi:hypothetical protein